MHFNKRTIGKEKRSIGKERNDSFVDQSLFSDAGIHGIDMLNEER